MQLKENYSLYQYQKNIVQWMNNIRVNPIHGSKGGILYVEMGLGKTFTTLEYIRQTGSKNNLIICSKTLIQEWLKQIEKFYEVQPSVYVLHNDYNKIKDTRIQDLKNADIVLTTYHMVSRANKINSECKFSDRLIWKEQMTRKTQRWCVDNYSTQLVPETRGSKNIYSLLWDNIICDESQTLTNWKTSFFQSVYALNTKYIFGLSGTPIKNNKKELIASLKFLKVTGYNYPHSWNKDTVYNNLFCLYYDVNYEKANVKLPETNEILRELHFDKEEIEILRAYLRLWDLYIGRHKDGYGDSMSKLMGLFTRFRQISLDKFLLTKTLPALHQYVEAIECKLMTDEMIKKYDHGLTFGGAKYKEILKIIDEVAKRDEKVIIFSSFTSYLDGIEKAISKNIPLTFIKSEDSILARTTKINKWKNDENNNVLMMNYRIGAEGLNLIEANNVVLLDTWWNFTYERQAIARCHRIGQTKTVNIYRLLFKNSIETLMYNKSVFKSDIFEKIKYGQDLDDESSRLSLANMTKIINALVLNIKGMELKTDIKVDYKKVDECAICLDEIQENLYKTNCNHDFHRHCIGQWKHMGNDTCPCCRTTI